MLAHGDQPKIHDARQTVCAQQHVTRRQVAVNQAAFVNMPQRPGDKRGGAQKALQAVRHIFQRPQRADRPAGQQRHGKKVAPLILPQIVNGNDAGVREPRQNPDLAQKALTIQEMHLFMQHFQRHVAPQVQIGGPEDLGAAALTNRLVQQITPGQRLTSAQRHRYGV